MNNTTDLFIERANQNISKWGLQDYLTLIIAITEEAGELAQAILQYYHEEGIELRIIQEATDLGALCNQIHMRYAANNK